MGIDKLLQAISCGKSFRTDRTLSLSSRDEKTDRTLSLSSVGEEADRTPSLSNEAEEISSSPESCSAVALDTETHTLARPSAIQSPPERSSSPQNVPKHVARDVVKSMMRSLQDKPLVLWRPRMLIKESASSNSVRDL